MIIRDNEKEQYHIIICDDNAEQLERMKIVCIKAVQKADADV